MLGLVVTNHQGAWLATTGYMKIFFKKWPHNISLLAVRA